MDEKKDHCHAFTIYDPNNIDKNKDSSNVRKIL